MRYALITAAHNEAHHIERILKAVVAQREVPARWVIVSDGSTDATEEVVRGYVSRYPWIELLPLPRDVSGRNFSRKAAAVMAGYERVRGLEIDLVGNLDADISFGPDFMAILLSKFREDPRLGLAGAAFTEDGKIAYDYRYVSLDHVSGQCQIFRKTCFEAIGGYKRIPGGGIDTVAVVSAQMLGWKTRTYEEAVFAHHREMGTATESRLRSFYVCGAKEYALGGHPVWSLIRTVNQMRSRPFVIGGLLFFLGYWGGAIRRVKRPVSKEFVEFRRAEQMRRMRNIIRRKTRTVCRPLAPNDGQ
jgi:glycosyltransferase involved in cell wall biosynthesis